MAVGSPHHPHVQFQTTTLPQGPSTGPWQPLKWAQAVAISHGGAGAAASSTHSAAPAPVASPVCAPRPTRAAMEGLPWPLLKPGDVTAQL